MENAGYTTLSRQSGLAREMQIVANNIANSATTGFRAEGLIFSEYVKPVDRGASLSMGQGNVRHTSFEQGALTQTGGAFSPSAEGELATYDGFRVLDAGGAPLFVPPGANIAVSADGTLSADGAPLGQMGLVRPIDASDMEREDGVMFRTEAGYEPAIGARVLQGSVENSNVNAVSELARMIEVQRAYELGQSFLESEDERVRAAIKSLNT